MNQPARHTPISVSPAPGDQDVFGRRTTAILAFFLSPLSLWLLFSGVTSLQSTGATGLPLGSPGGQLSMLLAIIGLVIISQTARWSAAGLFILAGWSAVFSLYIAASMESLWLPPMFHFQPLLFWCHFPSLVFCICLAAAIVTRWMREHTRDSRYRPPTSARSAWPVTILAFALALGIVALLFSLAPKTSQPLILRQAQWYLTFTNQPFVVVVLLLALVLGLTLLVKIGPMPVQLAAWGVLLLPGLVVIPLLTTVWEWMPTPDDEFAIALSLATPVAGALGATIAATTQVLLALSKGEEDGATK